MSTKLVVPPAGVFRGTNFMTPTVLAYYRGNHHGKSFYAELSEGTGMERQPIYGVTFRTSTGQRLELDPSGVFPSRSSAEHHIYTTGRN